MSRNDIMTTTSFLDGANAPYIEQMQAQYHKSQSSVDGSWVDFFSSLNEAAGDVVRASEGPSWARKDWPPVASSDWLSAIDGQWPDDGSDIAPKLEAKARAVGVEVSAEKIRQAASDSLRARKLIVAFRNRGHLAASLDPLGLAEERYRPELDPKNYGFTEADMDRPIFVDRVLGAETITLRELVAKMRATYCGTFALQYTHVDNPEEKAWLKQRIEAYGNEIQFTQKGRKAILNKLVEAEGFEKFLHVKYMGTKRFGLDGAEALIPAMEQIIKRGGQLGIEEIIIGMPHRGRLNVLANVMSKPYRAIFNEFQGGSFKPESVDGSGDVKYHLGASSDREFDGNKVHLSLTANPSHLEAVNPVVLGKVRAKQNQKGDVERKKVVGILLHGDAAFAGQGVVAEGFGLSQLKGHRTGGTIHIIVNNQIGFTTAPSFSRSSPYPTDIALMVEAPIFHVNGDDPEAVVHAARIATEYRQMFGKDVVVDIFCYRRFGHNEGDEPMFTNPKMYQRIKTQKTTLQLYTERLIKDGLIPEGEVEDMKAAYQAHLSEEFEAGKEYRPNKADWLDGKWQGLGTKDLDNYERGTTGVNTDILKKIGLGLYTIPEGFAAHKTIERLLEAKKEMFESGEGFDWATAEAMAFGSLLLEGFPVRLAGQDCTRGTFSHRHSGLVDQVTEERYYPLNNIEKEQAHYEVIDSMLSEYAVLGYEYGYSLAEPNALTLWEAQFGDFANGAQIMIDQFISSGEKKWLRMSGLVLLLPHGYEGQGPEHSSARPERYLQLSAEDNWIVANCTTPANYFHLLRRQIHRSFRKPLVVFSPKSLLRHKMCVSKLEHFDETSSFHRILWDDAEKGRSETKLVADDQIKRVVLCSGKVYYDLLEERDARGLNDVYLLRLEQLYPFPSLSLRKELQRFKNAEMIWCQEEPKNQGYWSSVEPNIEWVLAQIQVKAKRASYAGRAASASVATGLASSHKAQQLALINEALTVK